MTGNMHMEEAAWQRCRNGRQLNWRRKQSVRHVSEGTWVPWVGEGASKKAGIGPTESSGTRVEASLRVGVSGAGQLLPTCRGWCLLWDRTCCCGCLHLWDSDPGCLQLDTKHQSNFGKSWFQLLPQGVWHRWLWRHQWWCRGQLNRNRASIFALCLFSNGFPILPGELHQIPKVLIERAAAFPLKGGDFISHYVYTWNDKWDKDCWKNQSDINVLAVKFSVSR